MEKKSGKSLGQAQVQIHDQLVPITLRIPSPIHRRLKQISDAEYRSLNHQVILALSYFLDVHEKFGGLPHPDILRKALPGGLTAPQGWLAAAPRSTRQSE